MAPSQKPDYYKILQVDGQADPAVIQGAYRALLKSARMHPDLGGSSEGAQALNEAYAVLSDPAARRAYDRALTAREPAPDQPRVQLVAVPQYIFICPACRHRNLLADGEDLVRSRCGKCRRPLWRRERVEDPDDAASSYRLALYLFEKRLYERALRELRELVRVYPKHALYRYWLGRTLYQKRGYEHARNEFRMAARLSTGRFHFEFWWAQASLAMKDHATALKHYRKAAALRPAHLPTLLRMAACHAHLRDFAAAVDVMRRAIGRHPRQSAPHVRLGLYLLAQGDATEAITMLQTAARLAPDDPAIRRYLDGAQRAAGGSF
jgi:tetratricopeptide (TPR) repeat protein